MLKGIAAALMLVSMTLAGAAPAGAATISIVSMQYSKSQPVPHISYEGETVAEDLDALRQVYDTFVHCRLECLGDPGGPTAVVTLSGPGGNYYTGLDLAEFFRANHIATVVRKGDSCYSACAFAFLGGSGFSSSDRVGTYIDRVAEPGSTVGFHAPYFDDDTLRQALEAHTPGEVIGESRGALSLMVRQLVRWNVDPEILYYMVDKGPNETYDIKGGDDYYLVRTALPPTPTSAWITSIPEAVRNACIRLLALYERADPQTLKDRIDSPWTEGIATSKTYGRLSGYRLGNNLLDLGHCSVSDASVAAGYDLDIGLFMNPGIDGYSEPMLSFFNRQDYFSSAGIGASPLKRVFQRGGMNHWFLPVGIDVDSLDLPGEFAITLDRFFTIGQPEVPTLPAELTIDSETGSSRVAHDGNVWVLAETGNSDLYDAASAATRGVNLTADSAGDGRFFRRGTYADGTAFELVGLRSGNSAVVVHVLFLTDGAAAADEESALAGRVACGLELEGVRLACN